MKIFDRFTAFFLLLLIIDPTEIRGGRNFSIAPIINPPPQCFLALRSGDVRKEFISIKGQNRLFLLIYFSVGCFSFDPAHSSAPRNPKGELFRFVFFSYSIFHQAQCFLTFMRNLNFCDTFSDIFSFFHDFFFDHQLSQLQEI